MIAAIALLLVPQDRPRPEWRPVLDAPANVGHVLTIPPPEHPGVRIELKGRVLKPDGRTPAEGVILYFHHTDGRGIYPRPAGSTPQQWSYWHGSLRGWLKTDKQGRFVLRTTRPSPYPGRTEPAHIHVHALVPGSRTGTSLPSILFAGDPFLTESFWKHEVQQDGYRGTTFRLDKAGILQGQQDFILPRS